MNEQMEALRAEIQKNAERTERALEALGCGADKDLQVLFDSEAYSLLGGGKRIRPFLVNEVCRALGGKEEISMPFACALEMIHTYSLIHDDLPCMDDDDMRRGKPTNHKKFGYATALLAGDALLTKAFLVASGNPYADGAVRAEAVRLMADAAGEQGMIGGQIIDLEGETRQLPFETLLRLHSKKTGALIECAARLGALAAGFMPDTPESEAAAEYARGIGLAFQVIDDVLDACGNEAELGKTIGADASHHKTTFLTYYNPVGAKEYASTLTEGAKEAIREWKDAQTLIALAEYLLNRTY